MDITNMQVVRNILHYQSRIMLLKEERLPKKIYRYDVACKKQTWVLEVHTIGNSLCLPGPEHEVLYDLDVVQNQLWNELDTKPKLRTYHTFKEREHGNVLVKSNLPW